MMATADVLAVLAQSERALKLPDSTFRTEYDLDNTVSANIERLEATASAHPSVAAESRALQQAWRDRAAAWKTAAKEAGSALRSGGGLASVADYVTALQEEDEKEDDQANKPRKRRTRNKPTKSQHDNDDHMGERGSSLVALLGDGTTGPQSAPNPRSKSPPAPAAKREAPKQPAHVHEDVFRDAVLTSLPHEVTAAAATVQLVENAATAVLDFNVTLPFSPTTAPHGYGAGKGGKGGKGNKRGGKSPTSTPPNRSPRRSPEPGAMDLDDTVVRFRVTFFRNVLRGLLGLASASSNCDVPVLPLDIVRDVLPTITIGAPSKLPKALRAPKAPKAVAAADDVPSDSDDDEMPPVSDGLTQEYTATPVAEDAAGEDDGTEPLGSDEEDLEALSAKLVAEFKEVEEGAESPDGVDGRTGLPPATPESFVAAVVRLREAPVTVLMCHGGYFAGAVFVAGIPVVHKSFQRYVVRKKQGGKQSSQGAVAGSAGSQIRKMQEVRWRVDVKCILDDWRPFIDASWLIAYVAPSPENRKILTDFSVDWQPRVSTARPPPVPSMQQFFSRSPALKPSDALKSPVDIAGDARVFSAPLTTHRPTFAEVQRIYETVIQTPLTRTYHRSD